MSVQVWIMYKNIVRRSHPSLFQSLQSEIEIIIV